MTTLVSCIRADSERWSTLKREWEGSRHNETKVDPLDAQLSFFARNDGCACANGTGVAFYRKKGILFGIRELLWDSSFCR
mgnify:CR=1 FL=1